MNSAITAALAAGLLFPLSSTAFAQAGEMACQQDLQRIAKLYNEKQAALSDHDRADAQRLLEVARTKCEQGGPEALSTRSREATALLQKLEAAPSPSQAAVPPPR